MKLASIDSLEQIVLSSLKPTQKFNSKKEIEDYSKNINSQLKQIGFIQSTHDSITILNQNKYLSYFSLGAKIDSAKILIDESLKPYINKSIEKNHITLPFDKLEETLQEISNSFEAQGQPFTTVKLENISISKNTLLAELAIRTSKERRVDKIIIGGYKNFPRSFLKHYANLKVGQTFSKDQINNASKALNSLNYATESKEPEILFTKDSTIVYLYLKKQKANQFDGIIGFSSSNTDKLEFDGYLDLQLNNAINKGEQLNIQWKSNADDRKQFDTFLSLPFLFSSPITPEVNFNLYKQDSTFLNIKTQIRLKYNINPSHTLAATYFSESSNDLENYSTSLEIINFKSKLFGSEYSFRQFSENQIINYKTFIQAQGLFGNKTNTDNNVKLNQQRYNFKGYYNWKLNPRNFIFIQNQSGLLLSDELYTNELFRVGGTNTIRGFNEESIFCSSYIIFNLEYRYQLNFTSFLYSITDVGRIENTIESIKNNLYSFGIGYKYQLNSGIIDMSYALGKEESTPFNIQNTKFHIKLTQFF
ncbi:membrane protein [Urechidicola sp. KH5]